jgi:hypothetical protein
MRVLLLIAGLMSIAALVPITTAQTPPAAQCDAVSIRCPVEGGCIVNDRMSRARVNPQTGKIQPHRGVDLVAARGLNILAAATGRVTQSRGNARGFAELIVIEHLDGNQTVYGHLLSRSVNVGDSVTVGQVIGKADSTGTSTGDHLHFEYVSNGAVFVAPGVTPTPRIDPEPCFARNSIGSIRVSDNGALADDAFSVAIDGFPVGVTEIGQENNIAINNLAPGPHVLTITAIIAPDNVGTLRVDLQNGFLFANGSIFVTDILTQGESRMFPFTVPRT